MTLNEKIKAYRAEHGLSQRAFATCLGVSVITVKFWEQERRTPGLDSVGRLVKLSGIPLEEWINGVEFRPDRRCTGFKPIKPQQRVWQIVRRAIRAGTLARQPCESCGSERAHAHHEDYTRPLHVTWFCPKCHLRRHRRGVTQVVSTKSP